MPALPSKDNPMRRLLALSLLIGLLLAANVQLSAAAFTSSSRSTGTVSAAIDWTPPIVSLREPAAVLRGTVTLTADASDATTAVRDVTIEMAPTGGAWTPICTRTATPYSCSLATTAHPDGSYAFRATAVDVEGNRATSAVRAGRIIDNTGPTVEVVDPGDAIRGTVIIRALASDAGTGVASVRLQRAPHGGTTWTDLCTRTAAPYECALTTTSLANGLYDFRAIATDHVGNATTSAVVSEVMVDNLAPSVVMGDPGTPLAGTITLSATASDNHSGVAAVTIQHAPAGTATWTTVCTRVDAPYTCRFATTTVPDGLYDFRAVATDEAGNSAISAIRANRRIDNTVSSVSMEDPGAFLRGTEALVASASSTAGITSVRIQRAVSGTTIWSDVCTITAAPYSCQWDTTTVANGLYSFRAVLLDGTGATTTSNVVANRQVDNTPVRGFAVQGVNGGPTPGRVETGDRVVLTYNGQLNLSSVMGGWTGAPQTVTVRLRDGASIGLTKRDDTLDVFTAANLTTPVRVGSVNIRNDVLKKPATFTATMTAATVEVEGRPATQVTIVLGQLASGGTDMRTATTSDPMVWTPAAVQDADGLTTSNSPVNGAVVRNF
jgi:hypothetical protein